MSKHYHVKLLDNNQDILVFDYVSSEDALNKLTTLETLAEESQDDQISVELEICFDGFCETPKQGPKETFVRVPGSMGEDYIVNGDHCTCPDSIYRNHVCKHQFDCRYGVYVNREPATLAEYEEAKKRRLVSH